MTRFAQHLAAILLLYLELMILTGEPSFFSFLPRPLRAMDFLRLHYRPFSDDLKSLATSMGSVSAGGSLARCIICCPTWQISVSSR